MDNRLREVEVNLARVAQRVDDHEGDIHRFAGLPGELHEIRWAQGKMQESLDAAHGAIRDLSARIDREHEERIQGQLDRKRELEEAQAERNLELARIEKEQADRYMELQARADQQRLENRRMLIGLVTIFLTSATSVLVAVLTGGSA
jgi:regulator of protease activity HflC (stomatin/prohibitin superfamily)